VVLSHCEFPAKHWTHLRASNPVKSVHATVRHYNVPTKARLPEDAARLVIFKLLVTASKNGRRVKKSVAENHCRRSMP
jgi:putative transposase